MAKRKKKRIASRGSVNTTILKTLVNGDKYGYEIIKEVEEYSYGKIILKQPSLYSSLSRFEEKGIVTSYWGDSDIGGRRHYYHLTELGQKYYRSAVLKIKDGDEDDIITQVSDSLKSEDSTPRTTEQPISIPTELPAESIPAIVNFEIAEEKKEEKENPSDIIPDHNFINTTPIENIISSNTLNVEKSNREIQWNALVNRVKNNNSLCANSSFKKLHYKKPTKTQKVILDSDGIYKLRDSDYTPNKHNLVKSKIVDNVGKRINNTNIIDSMYAKNDSLSKPVEISQEEKLLRNQNFEERFNQLTQSKLKPVTKEPESIKPQSPIADKEPDFDYRSKLDILLQSKKEPEIQAEPKIQENNLFNYIDEGENKIKYTQQNEEYSDDKFINFDSDDFETKADNTQYIEEISNYANTETIKINRYENRSLNSTNYENNSYVLINKAKCVFGVILLLLCSVELLVSLLIFRNNGLMQENDSKIFIVGFIITALISISFIIPILLNSQEHRLNNYKLKYTQILGILTFLVSLILIYCINALLGFELDNFSYFAVELIVPAILTFNFVIMPSIYYAIIKCRKFYD